MADTVCKKDRRGRQILLVDAFVALLTVNPRCPARAREVRLSKVAAASMPSRRKPLVQITVDIATLLGLTASPAYLDGHGPIDPALARTLAEDATWAMLTEMVDLATELGVVAAHEISPQLVPSPSPSPSPSPMPMPGTGAGPTTRHLTSRRGGRGCTCSGPAAPGAAVVVCRAGRRDRVRGPGRHRVASAGRSRNRQGTRRRSCDGSRAPTGWARRTGDTTRRGAAVPPRRGDGCNGPHSRRPLQVSRLLGAGGTLPTRSRGAVLAPQPEGRWMDDRVEPAVPVPVPPQPEDDGASRRLDARCRCRGVDEPLRHHDGDAARRMFVQDSASALVPRLPCMRSRHDSPATYSDGESPPF
ncbi:hypothetical protein GTA07_27540 [Rhodococcus hoagii]|nr:hypothetical protein [Prescottella equi]